MCDHQLRYKWLTKDFILLNISFVHTLLVDVLLLLVLLCFSGPSKSLLCLCFAYLFASEETHQRTQTQAPTKPTQTVNQWLAHRASSSSSPSFLLASSWLRELAWTLLHLLFASQNIEYLMLVADHIMQRKIVFLSKNLFIGHRTSPVAASSFTIPTHIRATKRAHCTENNFERRKMGINAQRY